MAAADARVRFTPNLPFLSYSFRALELHASAKPNLHKTCRQRLMPAFLLPMAFWLCIACCVLCVVVLCCVWVRVHVVCALFFVCVCPRPTDFGNARKRRRGCAVNTTNSWCVVSRGERKRGGGGVVLELNSEMLCVCVCGYEHNMHRSSLSHTRTRTARTFPPPPLPFHHRILSPHPHQPRVQLEHGRLQEEQETRRVREAKEQQRRYGRALRSQHKTQLLRRAREVQEALEADLR